MSSFTFCEKMRTLHGKWKKGDLYGGYLDFFERKSDHDGLCGGRRPSSDARLAAFDGLICAAALIGSDVHTPYPLTNLLHRASRGGDMIF